MNYAPDEFVREVVLAIGADDKARRAAIALADAKATPFANRTTAEAASVPAPVQYIEVAGLRYRTDATGAALTTGDGRKWSPVGVVTAQHYGAPTDGVTDSRDALNAALNSGAKEVDLGEHVYAVSGPVQAYAKGLRLFSSKGAVIKPMDSAPTGFEVLRVRGSGSTVEGITIDANNASPALSGKHSIGVLDTNGGTLANVKFLGCTFQNSNGYGITAFNSGTLKGLTISGCLFRGFTDTATTPGGLIQLVQPVTSNVTIIGNTFEDATGCAIAIRSAGGSVVSSRKITIVGNIFDHGTSVYTTIGVEVWAAHALTLTGNVFRGARMGVSITGEKVTISANTFDDMASYAIEAASTNALTITGNTFDNFGYGVILYDKAKDVVIADNTFRKARDGATIAANLGWAVQLSASGLTQAYRRIKISGNIFHDCSGVRLSWGADITVADNHFETIRVENICRLLSNHADLQRAQVSDNTFLTAVDQAAAFNGLITLKGKRLRILDNRFESLTTAPNVGSAIVNEATGPVVEEWEVTGNSVTNFATGIALNHGSPAGTGTVVKDNTYHGCTTDYVIPQAASIFQPVNGGLKASGDADVTLYPNSPAILIVSGSLSANRVITLSSDGAYRGQKFNIVRTAGGTGTLTVTPISGVSALAQNEWIEILWDGFAWISLARGTR